MHWPLYGKQLQILPHVFRRKKHVRHQQPASHSSKPPIDAYTMRRGMLVASTAPPPSTASTRFQSNRPMMPQISAPKIAMIVATFLNANVLELEPDFSTLRAARGDAARGISRLARSDAPMAHVRVRRA